MSPPSARSKQVARQLSATVEPNAPLAAPGLPEPQTGGGSDGQDPKVLLRKHNSAVEILLNRPKAINALDSDMIEGIAESLTLNSHDPLTSCIILRGAEGSRGLCAGGDVLRVVNDADSNEKHQQALRFFQEEFELDWRIAKLGATVAEQSDRNARPMVAIMDGITMGGGVGLSVHCPLRIATENTRFAMPETGIGYFPDVGVSRILARLDGRTGTYLGLTGNHISGAEAYNLGLATHFIPSSSLSAALEALAALPPGASGHTVASCIDDFCVDPLDKKVSPELAKTTMSSDIRTAIDFVFSSPDVESVFSNLDDLIKPTDEEANDTQAGHHLISTYGLDSVTAEIRDWAKETLKTLSTKSPRSLKVTHQLIFYEARRFDLDQSFHADMRMATVFCDFGVGRDFYDGVHHVLTKDPKTNKRRTGRAPWNPSTINEVDNEYLRNVFFAPLATAEKHGLTLTPPALNIPDPVLDRASAQAREQRVKGLGPAGWEVGFNPYHALASEAELEALLHGSHPSAGSLAIDLDDESSVQELAGALRNTNGGRRGNALGLETKIAGWRNRRLRIMRQIRDRSQ